jgi:hypothetical protein
MKAKPIVLKSLNLHTKTKELMTLEKYEIILADMAIHKQIGSLLISNVSEQMAECKVLEEIYKEGIETTFEVLFMFIKSAMCLSALSFESSVLVSRVRALLHQKRDVILKFILVFVSNTGT